MTFTGAGVALGFIHPHSVDAGFVTSLVQTIKELPDMEVFDLGSGPRIATARNQLVESIIADERRFEFVVLADADMAFPSDTIPRILDVADEHTAPIVGALCFCVARAGRLEPTIQVLTETEGLQTVWDFPDDALVRCDATGGAFLVIHRSVFETMGEAFKESPYPFFADSQHGGFEWGEDITFCLRARKLGFPIHVHTGVEVGHIKPHVYGLDDYRRNRAEIEEIGYDQFRVNHYQSIGLLSKAAPTHSPQIQDNPPPMNRAARRRLERARG